jgi:2'-5' RNA ligase
MRLFIGIDLPEDLKKRLLAFQAELKELGIRGSWKARENLHITLEFFGEVEPNVIPILTKTMTQVAKNHRAVSLNVGGLGAFPSWRRPHTMWTAVRGELMNLNEIRDELHRELVQKGIALEDRLFKPHLTLASRPEVDRVDLASVQSKKIGEFIVKEIVLFESKAISGKRIYTHFFEETLVE